MDEKAFREYFNNISEELPPLPKLKTASNPYDELARLAGCIEAAIAIEMEENPDKEITISWWTILGGWMQWKESGIAIEESKQYSDEVLSAYYKSK